jgi:hypothetical protein
MIGKSHFDDNREVKNNHSQFNHSLIFSHNIVEKWPTYLDKLRNHHRSNTSFLQLSPQLAYSIANADAKMKVQCNHIIRVAQAASAAAFYIKIVLKFGM